MATRAKAVALIGAATLLTAATALAHIVEVVGTVVEHRNAIVEVQTREGVVTVKVADDTPVMRNRRRVEVSELKPGVRVEIQTLDDTDAELVAFLVTILPVGE